MGRLMEWGDGWRYLGDWSMLEVVMVHLMAEMGW